MCIAVFTLKDIYVLVECVIEREFRIRDHDSIRVCSCMISSLFERCCHGYEVWLATQCDYNTLHSRPGDSHESAV